MLPVRCILFESEENYCALAFISISHLQDERLSSAFWNAPRLLRAIAEQVEIQIYLEGHLCTPSR